MWVVSKNCGPLRLREVGLEKIARQDQDQTVCPGKRALHFKHEVRAGSEIPRLDDHLIAGRFHLPGDPFRPWPIVVVVADEEVLCSRIRNHKRY
jgi:hypothetical protein